MIIFIFIFQNIKKKACLKATEWCASENGYFRGDGFSSRFVTRAEMPVTMMRLNLVKGLVPVMQIAEGWIRKVRTSEHARPMDLHINNNLNKITLSAIES